MRVTDEDMEKSALSITSATKSHLKLTRAALVLFGGIKRSESDSFIDVEESLREISLQALDNNMYRGVPFEVEEVQGRWTGLGDSAKCFDELPVGLWLEMRRAGLDPDSHEA